MAKLPPVKSKNETNKTKPTLKNTQKSTTSSTDIKKDKDINMYIDLFM